MSILCLSLVMLSLNLNAIVSESKIANHLQPNDDAEFECVDIYKQSAFSHPLLKNHKIQMSPSVMPKFERNHESLFNIGFGTTYQIKGCPDGMVPIERTPMNADKLNKLRAFAKEQLETTSNTRPLTKEEPNSHYALVNSYPPSDKLRCGTRATMSIYNPAVKKDQVSMAQLFVRNGEAGENSIQVGWGVHPLLYGDNKTRLTTYWTADGSKTTGCYNTVCPGFVQVDPNARLGQSLEPVSVIGGAQYAMTPTIFKDNQTGNYWLVMDGDVKIGYWPKEILTLLNSGIKISQYGGWTTSSPDGISPPMGSGIKAGNDYNRSAFFMQIEIKACDAEFFFPDELKVSKISNTNCYGLDYWGYHKKYYGETFTFGGLGGQCGI